jgi:hypothetical protein
MRTSLCHCLILPLAFTALTPLGAQQPRAAQAGAPAPQRIAGAVVPAWTQMEQKLRARWAESYPRETVVAVEKVGEPKYIDEPGKIETSSSTSYSSVWDWSWSSSTHTTVTKGREGAFLRQDVAVTAERPNKTRAKFHVAALYKLTGGQWSFVEIPVGKVEEIAGAGAPAQPSDDEAAKLFAAAWTASRPDFTVHGATVVSKEFRQSGGRYWLTYKLKVDVTGTDKAPASLRGNRAVCEPADYSSVLRWDKDAAKWVADDKMIATVNETSYCTVP